MDFNKQISFRPSPEMAETLSALYEKCENKDISITNFLNQIVCENLKPVAMPDNSEFVERIDSLETQVDEQQNEIIRKDHTIRQWEEKANENARIAQQLQLENEQLKTKTSDGNDENKLFSDGNRFKLWCILQIFRKSNHSWTFEDMIFFIIKSYQDSGYLNLDKKDLEYVETIKDQYHGTL